MAPGRGPARPPDWPGAPRSSIRTRTIGLALLAARRAPAGAVSTMPVVHQLFSDGLSPVSLFSMSVLTGSTFSSTSPKP